MLPVLPREMLWTELKTLDEFFRLDPVNDEFFDVFVSVRDEFFSVTHDAEKVFNEVYYQLTRMVFEHPMPNDLDKYASEIKSDLGWSYSATLVMSMVYFLYDLSNLDTLNRHFLKSIRDAYGGPMYWMPFRKKAESLKRKKIKLEYQFLPQPYPATEFATLYVNWSAITRSYQLSCIEHVLILWSDIEDKEAIANMIMDSMTCSVIYHPQGMECEQVRRFLENYLDNRRNEHIAWRTRNAAMNAQMESKEQFDQEKKALLGRIAEQDAEITRLKTLLSDKKNEGKERRFTLVQIVDYCKNACPDYQSAQPIENMLLKMLFCEATTTEDQELIKSIFDYHRNKFYGNIKVDKVEQLNAVLGKDAKIQK